MKYDLEERLPEDLLRIINTVEQLPNTRTGNHCDILQETVELIKIFVTSIKLAEKKKK